MRVRILLILPLLCGLSLLTTTVEAQTIVSAAAGVSFTASASHTAVSLSGTPIVTRYELRFIAPAGQPAIAVVNLGKPTPVSGTITVKPVAAFGTLPDNVAYTAVIVAVGPGGEGSTPASSPFGRDVVTAPSAPSAPLVIP